MKIKEAFQLTFPPSLETVASPPNCTPITLPTLQATSCWMPEHTFLSCFILDLMQQQPIRVEKCWLVHVNFRLDIQSNMLTASWALVFFRRVFMSQRLLDCYWWSVLCCKDDSHVCVIKEPIKDDSHVCVIKEPIFARL